MSEKITFNIPSLIATAEFTPTAIMQKFALVYVQDKEGLSPNQILKGLGHSEQLWYQWKKKPHFQAWLQRVCTEFFGTIALSNVHRAIYLRALGNSPPDAKMFLERFDKAYRPTSKTEIDAYQGRRPPDAVQDSKDRIRKFNEQKALADAQEQVKDK